MVVGLGNPGRAYHRTRHNVGFEVVDELAKREGLKFKRSPRAPVETAEWRFRGQQVMLVKPLSFMNDSGTPVAALARRKGIGPESVLVVYDDVELAPGKLRVRPKGSAGGHNGMKSLIAGFGSEEFPRVRVGVGRPAPGSEMVQHVLTRFTPDERKSVDESVVRAADAVVSLMEHGVAKTMNEFNA